MTSERTLQRRLAEEGTNFTRLVDDTRRLLAQQYLTRRDVSLKKMSFQLGFSDPSAFCRACKRWFGVSPKQLQRGPSAAEALLARRAQVPSQNASTAGRLVYVKPN
jgi:AraC-like DNA-binding protein